MNELTCRNQNCEEIVTCDEEVVAVTCSHCCVTVGLNTEEI